ncbi:MAG: hypothetical protein OEW80_13010, partial [Gemmatimonadota bacterium]|nr:hypothetical protein [Gemmatimonadota bacterium]
MSVTPPSEACLQTTPGAATFRRAIRTIAVSLAALTLVTCTDSPVGPGRGGIAYVRLQPVFDVFSRVAPLTLDRVRVVVVRPATDTLANVSQSFSSTSTSVRLDIPVRLERTSEDLEIHLELYAGSILLFSGMQTARIAAGVANPVSQIPVTYQGPGSNVGAITLAPRDTTVFFGAAFGMQASAVDSQQAAVAQFYVSWSATGGTIDASGRFTAPSVRDTVFVTAVTPTGIMDSTRVFVTAAPATLVLVSGDAQSGSIGTRLAQPLVVRADGSDGRPVSGVVVSFQAVTGGGSVDSATATTDAQGLARTGATLGLTVGAQTFTATAPGLNTVTFSMTAASGGVKTWTGAVSSDWNTAGNWNPAALPGAGDSVVIPTFIPNAPSLTGNATVGALVIRGTGSNLTVAGNLTVQRGIALPDTNSFLDMTSGALAAGSVTLSGYQAFIDAPTSAVTVSGPTTLSGNRSFISARSATNSFGPVTISGSQPFFEIGGGTSGPVSVTGSGFWEAYGPVTVTGSPAFNVTGDASISTFGGAAAPITVNGDVLLGGTDGRLVPGPTTGGWTINGNLTITAAGRLVMTQNGDTVRVNGNVSFGGADET